MGVSSLSLIQAAIVCRSCSLSKRRLEKNEYKQQTITFLQEHLDTVCNMVVNGLLCECALDVEADKVSKMAENCLLCKGDKLFINRGVTGLVEKNKKRRDFFRREADKASSDNVIHLTFFQGGKT